MIPKYIRSSEILFFFIILNIIPNKIKKIDIAPISNENKNTVSVVPIFEPNRIAKADLVSIMFADRKAIVNAVTALEEERIIVRIIPIKKEM